MRSSTRRFERLVSRDAGFTFKHPAARIICKAKVFIVGVCSRGRDKNELTPGAELILRHDLQLPPNALLLVGPTYREVGEITRIVKIRYRPGNAHKCFALPSGYHEIAIGNHAFHAFTIMNRPPLVQRGSRQQINELVYGNGSIDSIFDTHDFLWWLTFDVRGRRSGEAAKETHKRSLWAVPLNGIVVRHGLGARQYYRAGEGGAPFP